MNIIKKLSQVVILNLVFILVKEVKNDLNLPKNQFYIVASNHSSHIDPFIIASIVFKNQRRIVQFIGKKESLTNPTWRFIYHTFGVITIDRNSKSKTPIITAIRCLNNKNIIGIFPEGTRTPDGKIHKGKTGVARIALHSNACVVPVAIKGTFHLWPKHKKFPKIRKIIKVNIGKPMDFKNYRNKKISKKILRLITNSIMKRINNLYRSIK